MDGSSSSISQRQRQFSSSHRVPGPGPRVSDPEEEEEEEAESEKNRDNKSTLVLASPRQLLEHQRQAVQIVHLGHFFIASPKMERSREDGKSSATPRIEEASSQESAATADSPQQAEGKSSNFKAKRQRRLATSSSIVFDQSQQSRIQITHENYMSIVDLSPTTPPSNLPKFPTNVVPPPPPPPDPKNYGEPPPTYSAKASKMMGTAPPSSSARGTAVSSSRPAGTKQSQSRQCFDEKKAKTTTELLLMEKRETTCIGTAGSDGIGDGLLMPSLAEQRRPSEAGGERETWERKIDFLLSVVGFAVDLANVWRFPYLCFKNGGGAFLIPYSMMVLLAGIPLFYMELALGQFHRKGAITTWGRICPLFKGIGYCVIATAFYTDFFYNVIIAYALHYFYASFTTHLPWSKCTGEYNSPACYEPSWSDQSHQCAEQPRFVERNVSGNGTQMTEMQRPVSAAEEYFYKHFLGLHAKGESVPHVQPSIDDLGPINWEIVACLLVVYLICYFSLWKGIKMSGKVVWFTAIFPYVVLVCLLIRGITLPGSEKGIEYYLNPDLERLKDPYVWQDAATQVFFSLGPGFGVLMAYSSYNEFHNNVYFDALLTSTINCATSFLAGFVIFSVLGYMSCKSGKPIHEVAQEGPGLVFVVYPEALATMPGATVWSLIFFLMLLTLGLDSSFGGSEAIITGLSDEFPLIKRNREIFVAILFTFYMVIGLTMCTRGGMLVMEWLIVYGTTWGLLIAVFCETMVISFCYGIRRFCADIHSMLGFEPGWYWRICWTVGAPLFLIAMIISSFINLQPLQYQDYNYPPLANGLGIVFALSSVSAIPLVGLWMFIKADGSTWSEKFQNVLRPADDSPVGGGRAALENGSALLLRPEMIRATRVVSFARLNSPLVAEEPSEFGGGEEAEEEEEQFLQTAEHGDVLL